MKVDTIHYLESLASRSCWSDNEDFNPYDLSGGNFDDAFWGGFEDGRAELAREILAEAKGVQEAINEAYQRGFSAGVKQGYEKGEARHTS